jgi:stage II sporulation protein D
LKVAHRNITLALGVALIVLLQGGCGAPTKLTLPERIEVGHPLVRVLLPFTDSEFITDGTGRFIAQGTTAEGGEVTYYCSRTMRVTFTGRGWELSEDGKTVLETNLARVSIWSKDPSDHLLINGKQYPGSLVFYPPKTDGAPPLVVNRVHVDDYLLGVLPPELGRRTPQEFEAIKAQAVASRTYALAHLGQYKGQEYDLRADHHDQIYVGLQTPRQLVKDAVDQTAGEVLRYRGDLIEAYYHSTCGGRTDDITSVWGKHPRPYLVMTEDDTFCNWSKYSEWTETWNADTLKKNLMSYLKTAPEAPFDSFERIFSIRTEGRTPGGRVLRLVILTDRGSWSLPTDKTRWALGRPSTNGPILESANFTLYPEYAEDGALVRLTAVGSGYGHGVGMCQCGMIGRARAGQDYREILTHYYSGVQIKKTY